MILKKLKPILIILFIMSCKKTAHKPVWMWDDDKIEILKGDVKEVYIEDSSLATGNFKRIDFDESGNMALGRDLELEKNEANGVKDSTVFVSTTKYTAVLDKKGRRIALLGDRSVMSTGSDTGTTNGKFVWNFDKNGQLINDKFDEKNESLSDFNEYQYNKVGDLIRFKRSFYTKIEPEVFIYEYDNSRRMIEEDEGDYDSGVDLFYIKTTFKYINFDSHGNWIKMVKHRQSFRPLTKTSSTYTVERKITYY